jgi:hypothetical protein
MDAAGSYAGGVILALDVATRTGVAWGEPGGAPQTMTIDLGKPLPEAYAPAEGLTGKGEAEVWARGLVFTNRFLNVARAGDKPVSLIVVEGLVPQYDKTLQCGLWAVIKAVAAIRRIPVLVAHIGTWRAFVLGDGKLKRDVAKTRAVQTVTRLGWDVDSHDAAEAACIWLWGCSQVAPARAHRAEPLFLGRGAA